MKKLLILLALFNVACTPEIKNAFERTKEDVQTYDYSQLKPFFLGDLAITDKQKAEKEQLTNTKQNCVHDDAEVREITENGVSDVQPYKHCTIGKYPDISDPARP